MSDPCVRCGVPAAHLHHRKRRSQGGDDSEANLIYLCFDCHEWVHRNVGTALATGYLVGSWEEPANVPIHTHKCSCGLDLALKPKRKRLQGEARRKRRRITIAVPNDTENGGEIWDETLDRVKERLITEGLYDEADNIPVYEALMAALNDWMNNAYEQVWGP